MDERAARTAVRGDLIRLRREATRLADEAQLLADSVSRGGPYSDRAYRMMKLLSKITLRAARIDAIQETQETLGDK